MVRLLPHFTFRHHHGSFTMAGGGTDTTKRNSIFHAATCRLCGNLFSLIEQEFEFLNIQGDTAWCRLVCYRAYFSRMNFLLVRDMSVLPMTTYLFINPCAGRYDRNRISTVIKQLHDAGLSPVACTVTETAAFRAINDSDERPLVIVAAGDGTINAVVNGLEPDRATLAILPMGTSNVLAAELGIRSIDDGICRILAGATRSLSVGVLELEPSSRRFVLMAGIGFDGAVVRDVWLPGKRFLKQGAYALSALRSALSWDTSLIELHTPEQSITCHSVVICNSARYGGSFVLAPETSIFSPGLTAVCVQKNSRRTYLQLACELFLGRSATSRTVLRIPVTDCGIRGVKPLQIDGDFIGYSPARVTTLTDFARIIV